MSGFRTLVVLGLVCLLGFSGISSGARNFAGSESNQLVTKEVSVADLPRQARETLRLIERGGPFSYARDGTVFNNREHLLPARSRGYYREYTVQTPGARDRGARRIIAGGPGEYYYSDDHYASFKRIRE